MQTISPLSSDPYTILNDRILWDDGDSSYFVEALRDKILSGDESWDDNYVFDLDDFSVKQYNSNNPNKPLKEKSSIDFDESNLKWKLPDAFSGLDIRLLLTKLLKREFSENNFTPEEKTERVERVKFEIDLWERSEKIELIRTLVYIVDVFRRNNIVWGTGRGSSCCSYILYLIGVHDVDSVYYDLDIRDFFRV